MVVVDEKTMLPPPPPYVYPQSPSTPLSLHPPPFSAKPMATIYSLPPSVLLHIVHHTFPQVPGLDEGRLERQRRTLYWLSTSLRLVNRAIYVACMHVLRSTYLPSYNSLIRAPYSSDPFPLNSLPSQTTSTPLLPSLQRETAVLDKFIALKVREDVWADESDLHLERDESFRDLFDLMQPRARVEDLVRVYGERYGCVFPPGTTANSRRKGIEFSALSASFSPRRVGLALVSTSGRRTIVDVERTRDEKLEVAAKRLAKGLCEWLATG
ncbi:hypothetical protein BV25DRAFT_1826734 [Artomyces pyxidatus]|uniref:Uncharacterized protein n=1 Tax=Artomyces pyxidatus TaxID=48021 RepID=A0ACB8SZ73_9AGAM|nr:hypothetical protein BV25DRAFT_1826734 [Artomyces pyxidatus]